MVTTTTTDILTAMVWVCVHPIMILTTMLDSQILVMETWVQLFQTVLSEIAEVLKEELGYEIRTVLFKESI